jgi:hypothetical protein
MLNDVYSDASRGYDANNRIYGPTLKNPLHKAEFWYSSLEGTAKRYLQVGLRTTQNVLLHPTTWLQPSLAIFKVSPFSCMSSFYSFIHTNMNMSSFSVSTFLLEKKQSRERAKCRVRMLPSNTRGNETTKDSDGCVIPQTGKPARG